MVLFLRESLATAVLSGQVCSRIEEFPKKKKKKKKKKNQTTAPLPRARGAKRRLEDFVSAFALHRERHGAVETVDAAHIERKHKAYRGVALARVPPREPLHGGSTGNRKKRKMKKK
jgi:hypothetical protein